MKKEEIQAPFESYEATVCVIDDTECWSARELCQLLGYTQWRNFNNVIDKAKEACKNAGQSVSGHFADVSKMVTLGSGARRGVNDQTFAVIRSKGDSMWVPKHDVPCRAERRAVSG